jgi:hypothetical protein
MLDLGSERVFSEFKGALSENKSCSFLCTIDASGGHVWFVDIVVGFCECFIGR